MIKIKKMLFSLSMLVIISLFISCISRHKALVRTKFWKSYYPAYVNIYDKSFTGVVNELIQTELTNMNLLVDKNKAKATIGGEFKLDLTEIKAGEKKYTATLALKVFTPKGDYNIEPFMFHIKGEDTKSAVEQVIKKNLKKIMKKIVYELEIRK